MNASELTTKAVHSCGADDSFQRAAQIMWEKVAAICEPCATQAARTTHGVGQLRA